MNKWLTLRETCIELCLGPRAILGMLRRGQLVGYRLPRRGRNKYGRWLILDPGAKFARFIEESKRHVEHVPLLTNREVAEVLSVSPGAIRQLKKRGHLRGARAGKATLYTAAEIRGLLFRRERATRGRKRHMYSPILARWLGGLVNRNQDLQAEVIHQLPGEAVLAPATSKARYTVELWKHFDAINSLLDSAKAGEDFACAVEKAKPENLGWITEKFDASDLVGWSKIVDHLEGHGRISGRSSG